MKKFFYYFVFFMFVTILLPSCSNPAKVLPSKDGKWDFSLKVTGGGSSSSETGTITFKKSGSGTISSSGTTESFNWSYNKNGEEITLTSGGDATIYEIIEAKPKSEKWQREENILGTVIITEINLTR